MPQYGKSSSLESAIFKIMSGIPVQSLFNDPNPELNRSQEFLPKKDTKLIGKRKTELQ